MSPTITRVFKPLLRLFPLMRTRRRRTTPKPPPSRPQPTPVLGVGAGSVGFPHEESGR
ncbi:hypothetical protein [Streptomyces sp. NPDC059010]|uniref:hypothetical protein n=1 Tax=Streptomyces sp. NPDC059010 TaxID=3346695 RepID=UPI0036C59007